MNFPPKSPAAFLNDGSAITISQQPSLIREKKSDSSLILTSPSSEISSSIMNHDAAVISAGAPDDEVSFRSISLRAFALICWWITSILLPLISSVPRGRDERISSMRGSAHSYGVPYLSFRYLAALRPETAATIFLSILPASTKSRTVGHRQSPGSHFLHLLKRIF